jgi:hypothetical protein
VNLFEPAESRLAPAAVLRLGQAETTAAAEREDVGQRELWPWLALLAFLVLLAEWWIYHRGPRWPRPTWPRLRRPDGPSRRQSS